MNHDLKIWDTHNKQWLRPISIYFDPDGNVHMVHAMKMEHTDMLKDGWYKLEGDDLKKIAITGNVTMNEKLLPKE